jgi:hypothetical protein
MAVKDRKIADNPEKQKEFIQDVQKTFDPAQSVKNVYGYSRYSQAKNNTGLVLGQEGVRGLMNDPAIGLDDGHLLDRLKSALNAKTKSFNKITGEYEKEDNHVIQLKAIELAFKLKGYLSPDFNSSLDDRFKQITVNFNLVKARDTDEVKKLLGDMPSVTVRDAIMQKPIPAVVVEEVKEEEKKEEPKPESQDFLFEN